MARMAESYVYDTPVRCAPSECPVEDWLAFLGHRWNAGILWHLSASPKRYGDLAECLIGITPKVLTERLQGLQRRGLIQRSVRATFPRNVTYSLTREGLELVDIVSLLEPWAKRLPGGDQPILASFGSGASTSAL